MRRPAVASRLNQTNAQKQVRVQVPPQTDWRRGHRGTDGPRWVPTAWVVRFCDDPP